jgi:predicted nucleotidyltransferase
MVGGLRSDDTRDWMICFLTQTVVKFNRKRAYEMDFTKDKNISLGKLKKDLLNFFKNRDEVLLVYLFGSCLRGKFGKNHDIDIAIFVDSKICKRLDAEKPYGYEAEMITELIHLLKHKSVDLVLLNKATPLLAYEVIHNGILLFSRSEDLRIAFELSSLKRHADTKPLRDIKRIYSKIRSEKGISMYA